MSDNTLVAIILLAGFLTLVTIYVTTSNPENALQSTITAQADSIRVLNDSLAYYEPHKAREALLRHDLRHCDDMLDYNIRKMQRVGPQ